MDGVRRFVVGIGTVALMVGAAACASGDDVVDAGEEIVLRVLLADDWADTDPVVDAVRSFEADHPGVRVQLQGLAFPRIPDAVASGIETGEPHDVAQWHAFAAAALGVAEPMDDLWERDLDPADYLPGAVTDVTWTGQRYGVPLDTNATILLSNAELVSTAGAAGPPATFEEFRSLAAATTAEDGSVRGTVVSASSWTTYGWIRANGGEVVEIGDDGTPTFTLDSPAVIETLDFLGGLVEDGIAYPPFSRDVTTDAAALFQDGSTALLVSGTWDVASLGEVVDWEPEVALLPRGDATGRGGSALGGSSLFVPKGAAHRELAFEFMVHLTRDEVALELAKTEGRLPARTAVFDDPFFETPEMRIVREQLDVAHPMLLIAYPEASQAFKEATEDVLARGADAATALRKAQDIAEASLASSGP